MKKILMNKRKISIMFLVAFYLMACLIMFQFTMVIAEASSKKEIPSHVKVTQNIDIEKESSVIIKTLIENMIDGYNYDFGNYTKEQVVNLIYDTAQEYNQNPLLVTSVIAVESSFNHMALSYVGAKGLMQVMPAGAIDAKRLCNIKEFKNINQIYDPAINLRLGTCYLQHLNNSFSGNHIYYITAYNFGPTGVRRRLAKYNAIPTHYYNLVIQQYNKLISEAMLRQI